MQQPGAELVRSRSGHGFGGGDLRRAQLGGHVQTGLGRCGPFVAAFGRFVPVGPGCVATFSWRLTFFGPFLEAIDLVGLEQ